MSSFLARQLVIKEEYDNFVSDMEQNKTFCTYMDEWEYEDEFSHNEIDDMRYEFENRIKEWLVDNRNNQYYVLSGFNTIVSTENELIKRRFIIGGYSLLKENQEKLFLTAQKCRHLIVDAVNNILADNDVIYLPASPNTAPLFNAGSNDKLSNEYLIADNYLAIGNFGGLPSLTLPLGFEDGLPFGGNVTGRAFDEQTVFNISLTIEEITGLKDLVAKEGK